MRGLDARGSSSKPKTKSHKVVVAVNKKNFEYDLRVEKTVRKRYISAFKRLAFYFQT